jgi:uncharacterized protein YkwD
MARTLAVLALLQTAALAQSETPAANEQLMIYELNRARQNPLRYAAENGLGSLLDGIAATPPLAVNGDLVQSASFHAEEMASANYFAHQSAVNGDWPNQMAINAGYPLPSPGGQNNIESIAAGYSDVLTALRALIEDAGVTPPGHRYQLLATGPGASFWLAHREIGAGYGFNAGAFYQRYYGIHTAYRSSGPTLFLTGVVYSDGNGNGRFDLNEGIGGVTVSDGTTTTLSNAAGGWSLATAAGTYTLTASGGTFSGISTAGVTVGSSNVEIDFESGTAAGEVNFANQGGPPPPPPPGGGGDGADHKSCGATGAEALLLLALIRRRTMTPSA